MKPVQESSQAMVIEQAGKITTTITHESHSTIAPCISSNVNLRDFFQ
jgi:hypothetical protein